jgi:hypothetical protein
MHDIFANHRAHHIRKPLPSTSKRCVEGESGWFSSIHPWPLSDQSTLECLGQADGVFPSHGSQVTVLPDAHH